MKWEREMMNMENEGLWEWEYLCPDTYRLKVDKGFIYRYHNANLVFVPSKK